LLAEEIPLAVLAGILIMTGITMFDYDSIKILKDEPKTDAAVMLVTMSLTVAIDLMVAVGVGIVMSALIFMKRMSEEGFKIDSKIENNIKIYKLEGPLYFGATEQISKSISSDSSPNIAIELEKVTIIDASGAMLLLQLKERGQNLYLVGNDIDLGGILRKLNVFQRFGETGHFESQEELLRYLDKAAMMSEESVSDSKVAFNI
jgi:sulfate permease, SulP family